MYHHLFHKHIQCCQPHMLHAYEGWYIHFLILYFEFLVINGVHLWIANPMIILKVLSPKKLFFWHAKFVFSLHFISLEQPISILQWIWNFQLRQWLVACLISPFWCHFLTVFHSQKYIFNGGGGLKKFPHTNVLKFWSKEVVIFLKSIRFLFSICCVNLI